MADAGKRFSTIERRLLGTLQLLPCAWQFADLRNDLDNVRRSIGVRQKQARPLLAESLRRALQAARADRRRDVRDACMLLVGWLGALRVSELAQVQWADLEWVDRGIVLTIRRSKTDQFGEGATVALPRHVSTVCDVCTWLRRLRDIAPTGDSLWQTSDGRPMSHEGVRRALRQALHRWCGPGYQTHSLRSGWISEAARSGAQELAIARHSRHKGLDMVARYTREARLWEDSPAELVSGRL